MMYPGRPKLDCSVTRLSEYIRFLFLFCWVPEDTVQYARLAFTITGSKALLARLE